MTVTPIAPPPGPKTFETVSEDERLMLVALLGLDDTHPSFFGAGTCSQTDPEAFFPEKGESNRDAKRVCFGCPVREECLEWAIDNDEHGIWGGTSKKERSTIRRKRETRAA